VIWNSRLRQLFDIISSFIIRVILSRRTVPARNNNGDRSINARTVSGHKRLEIRSRVLDIFSASDSGVTRFRCRVSRACTLKTVFRQLGGNTKGFCYNHVLSPGDFCLQSTFRDISVRILRAMHSHHSQPHVGQTTTTHNKATDRSQRGKHDTAVRKLRPFTWSAMDVYTVQTDNNAKQALYVSPHISI